MEFFTSLDVIFLDELELYAPTPAHRIMVLDYQIEFISSGGSMDGSAGLSHIKTFEDWLTVLEKNSREETVSTGTVPSSTFLAIRKRDNRLVGMINLRHRLNESLKRYGGHIGYSVRRSERGHGYAREMLRQALEKCIQMNIFNVMVSCFKSNIPSRRTIISCGGRFDSEAVYNDQILEKYYIPLFTLDNIEKCDYDSIVKFWSMTDSEHGSLTLSKAEFEILLDKCPGFKAVVGEKPIGAVLCGCDGVTGIMYNLAVSSECRNQGIGKALKQAASDALQNLGARCWTVVSANDVNWIEP